VEQRIKEVEEKDRIRNWKNPLSGEEIMEALNIEPSRTVGDVKDAVKEAILNGDIPNEHDAAYAFMMEHKNDFLNDG
jgi:tRNA nucleotidyltransferase (CCA-adding enzyme)